MSIHAKPAGPFFLVSWPSHTELVHLYKVSWSVRTWSVGPSYPQNCCFENIITEEQAGFRVGRSTTEQIFNLRILCEKYLQHQQDLYHIFIDFKKAFNRVGMQLCGMTKYNISTSLIQVIKNFCEKATSAVLFNSSTDWFRTKV